MINCDLCGSKFQFGPSRYDGKVIPQYKLTLCRPCFSSNWDGFAPHYETFLERHWTRNGITFPNRNNDGLYPRGS